MPNEILIQMINDKFNNYENFISEFKKNALSIKGSGYTFLVLDGESLEIVNLLNQIIHIVLSTYRY